VQFGQGLTDFGPAADVVTRAFAAAGASPVLEDSVSPSRRGELASANLGAGDEAARGGGGDATTGGCRASPSAASTLLASPFTLLLGVAMAMRILLYRRRPDRR
jgi:hypothetical protein